MLLQHFDAKHEVVNVQVLDDYSRETFASNFSPLIPSVRDAAVTRPLRQDASTGSVLTGRSRVVTPVDLGRDDLVD